MRGIYQKSTGKLIEASSSSHDETLTNNAINAGYSADDLELRDIADLDAELARLNPPDNIAAIKAKAGQIILDRLPDYKQRNYLARKAELQDILIAGGTLSASEQAEWDFFAAEWAWAKAVRETSNAAEIAGTPVDEIVWPI